MTVHVLCMLERKYEVFIAQYKIKDAGLIDGIVKFIHSSKYRGWLISGFHCALFQAITFYLPINALNYTKIRG